MNALNGAGQLLESVRSPLFPVAQPRADTSVPPAEQLWPSLSQTEPTISAYVSTARAKSHLKCFRQVFFPLPLISKEQTAPFSTSPAACAPVMRCSEPPLQTVTQAAPAELCCPCPRAGVCAAPSSVSTLFTSWGCKEFLLRLFEQAVHWSLVHQENCCINNRITLLHFLNLCNTAFRKHFLPLIFQLGFQVPLCTVPWLNRNRKCPLFCTGWQ